jgi:hypothetical protein
MEHLSIENIYREIVACTMDGQALTREEYQKQVNLGIEQCMKGESISLEDLCEELGYNSTCL